VPAAPTVSQILMGKKRFMVICPMCTDGTRIARDPSSWINHMVKTHSAVAESFTSPTNQTRGAVSGMTDEYNPQLKFANICYGCGSSFSTAALLSAHILADHT
jgi:NADH:ubiquinone oxidoreductase subunit